MSDKTTKTIRRDGELSIRNCAELMVELEVAIRNDTSVVVDLDAIRGADITILQILISAHRTAASRGVPLSIRAAEGGALAAALAKSGILDAPDATLSWTGDAWTGLNLNDGEKAA